MLHPILALLGACWLAAALLGAQASEPAEPKAQPALQLLHLMQQLAGPMVVSSWVFCADQQPQAFVGLLKAALSDGVAYTVALFVKPGECIIIWAAAALTERLRSA